MSAIGHIRAWFGGRISRKTWWIWTIGLLVAAIGTSLMLDMPAFDPDDNQAFMPTPWHTLAAILFFFPTLAITLKRLNDRDHKIWIGWVWGTLTLLQVFLPYLGVFDDPLNLTKTDWALQIPALLFCIWVLIDNAFLKGTAGPNRFGPDPLASRSQQSISATGSRAAKSSGRTWGANVRDFTVGLFAAIAVLFLVIPVRGPTGLLDMVSNAIISWYVGDVEAKMKSNPAGWKAFQAGKKAANQKDYQDAIGHYGRALESYGAGTNAAGRVYMWRGHALTRLRRWNDALKDYTAAIEINPDASAIRYSSRAYVLRKLDRNDEALSDYDEAIRLWPEYSDYYIRRGDLLRKLGRPQDALASYDEAIKAADDDYDDWKSQVDLLNRLNRLTESGDLSKYESITRRRAKSRNEAFERAELKRGFVLRDMGRFDDALKAFDKVIRMNPDEFYAYTGRGWIYEKQGKQSTARADYEAAAKLKQPNDWLKRALERTKPGSN